MSHYHHFNLNISLNPHPQVPTKIGLQPSGQMLASQGFNMLMEISTASAFVNNQAVPNSRKTIAVVAHFDTGASLTTIDSRIAQHLELSSIGVSPISTANGVTNTNNYAVDVAFINTGLRSMLNLQVSSCTLAHFNIAHAIANPNDPRNFGILIGRDIMSAWSIVWNGPTSTVLISD